MAAPALVFELWQAEFAGNLFEQRQLALVAAELVLLVAKRFGVTGVVDAAGALVGVITDGDLRRSFSNGFADRPVNEMMTRSPRSISPDMMATEALAELNDANITTLFVVDGGKPVGILHVHDLLRAGVV